jgi:quinol monooxygenase YgiN
MVRRCCLLVLPALVLGLALSDARGQDENPVVKLIKSKVKDESKTFAILVTFKVKAGKEKEFEAAFRPCLEATKKEPGCVSYELNRDPDAPETYVMYEKFRGIPALEYHLKQKHTQTLLSTVIPMCDGDPQIKVYAVPE